MNIEYCNYVEQLFLSEKHCLVKCGKYYKLHHFQKYRRMHKDICLQHNSAPYAEEMPQKNQPNLNQFSGSRVRTMFKL